MRVDDEENDDAAEAVGMLAAEEQRAQTPLANGSSGGHHTVAEMVCFTLLQ